MRFLRWLYRLPGRVDRSVEKTALASSVVQGEGSGGTHPNAVGVKAALGEIEATQLDDEGTEQTENT